MTGRTHTTGSRLRLVGFLREHGPATVAQIAEALQWDRLITMRAVQHGIEADVVAVHGGVRGKRTYVVGTVLPRLQQRAQAPRVVTPYHRSGPAAPAVTITREGSGVIAGRTYCQQLARDILAQHELERQTISGPRKPGRGRPVSA